MKETHPWVKFPESSSKNRKLILGSFPPNKFTTLQQLKTNCDFDFYYGSKDNEFWDLFSHALNLNFKFPDQIEDLKNYLKLNYWVISDVVLECNRRNNTALDKDLINIKWNTEIINQILEENPIVIIFFTSKWVKEKFDKHINNNLNTNIKTYILPSPSRNGLRSIGRLTYLEFNKTEEETASEFRLRYYKNILNKN